MDIKLYYKVAGLNFGLTLPRELALPEVLNQYSPFVLESEPEGVDFTVDVSFDPAFVHRAEGLKMRCFNDQAPFIWLDVEGEELIAAGFSNRSDSFGSVFEPPQGGNRYRLFLPEGKQVSEASFQINNALMLAYAYRANAKEGLMVHASVIVNKGKGYIFLGRSGTGKSTHARLWLKHIEGSRLLNDDNPVVYMKEGRAYVSGTPWSGKTPCYINEEYPLAGIVRLSQAPHNQIRRFNGLQAYAAFLPSCSCMVWNKAESRRTGGIVEKMIMQVPLWHLECLPDEDAARICSETVCG